MRGKTIAQITISYILSNEMFWFRFRGWTSSF